MTGLRALALATVLLMAGVTGAGAGDTQVELVPEVNAYLRLYYARQEDQRSSTDHIDRIGLVLKTYW